MSIVSTAYPRRQSNPNPPRPPLTAEAEQSARQEQLEAGRWPAEMLNLLLPLSTWRLRSLVEELS